MTIEKRALVNGIVQPTRVKYLLMNRILDVIAVGFLLSLLLGFISLTIIALLIWFVIFPFQLLYHIYHIEAHG